MIHCYFKSYETHAVCPVGYMEGLGWRRQIGTPLPFYREGLLNAAKLSKHTQTTAVLGHAHCQGVHETAASTVPLCNGRLKQQPE